MNILYATDFHNRANSGIAFAANELAGQIREKVPQQRGSVSLLSVGDTDISVPEGVQHLKTAPANGPARIWRYAPDYRAVCERIIREESVSVVHIHGIWMYPQLAAARAAQRAGIPTVLTNHGGIQWALKQPFGLGAAKKRLYVTIMRDSLLRRITVQHAITPLERDALFSVFPHPRIEVVPNFVDVTRFDRIQPEATPERGDRYVLYLGRLHPTKGVDTLIEAFSRAAIPGDWRLLIVGPEVDPSFGVKIRSLIAASPRRDRIALTGPVWDTALKYRLLRRAWIAAVPSLTEAISLVNLEASACYTPTITTTATGLTDWTEGGGLLIETGPGPLASTLSEVGQWSDEERKQRGLASRRLVEKRYSAEVVVPRWLEIYRSLQ